MRWVGIATVRVRPRGGETLRTHPDRHWSPLSVLQNGYGLSFSGLKGGGEAWRWSPTPFKLRGLACLARNLTEVTTVNARSVEGELKLYQNILNGWPRESVWNEKSQLQGSAGRVSVTITGLHKIAWLQKISVHRAACGRNLLSLLRLKTYVKSNTTERNSDPCLTSLEKEPVKWLDSEKAVDKFVSENQNRILLNK
jgi:hypothetical protein